MKIRESHCPSPSTGTQPRRSDTTNFPTSLGDFSVNSAPVRHKLTVHCSQELAEEPELKDVLDLHTHVNKPPDAGGRVTHNKERDEPYCDI